MIEDCEAGTTRRKSLWEPFRTEGAGESGRESMDEDAGPVKIHRSLTREGLVREIEARREKELASRDDRRERMWRRESVAIVSS